jgi:hypothetical protein
MKTGILACMFTLQCDSSSESKQGSTINFPLAKNITWATILWIIVMTRAMPLTTTATTFSFRFANQTTS